MEPFRQADRFYSLVGFGFALAMAAILGLWAYSRLKPAFIARVKVERAVMGLLLLASLVAILTCSG